MSVLVTPRRFKRSTHNGVGRCAHNGVRNIGLTIPSHLKLLWCANRAGADHKRSLKGNSLTINYPTGVIPGPDGTTLPSTSVGYFEGKGVYGGPALTNLLAAPTEARTVALTAQKYCLQCADGSVDAGAYGTATPSSPLIFTASAGNATFTPTGVTKWMLSASGGYVFPIIPASVSVVSTASGSTKYAGWEMDQAVLDALGGVGGSPAVFTVLDQTYMGVGSGELAGDIVVQNYLTPINVGSPFYFRGDTVAANSRINQAYDGTNYLSLTKTWSRDEIHRRIVQTKADGSQFRVGYQRLSSAGVPIDASIQLGSWMNFDGSMNPLAILKMFYSATTPNWKQLVAVSNKSMSDAEILKAFGYWRF